jgi:hypothetical protein
MPVRARHVVVIARVATIYPLGSARYTAYQAPPRCGNTDSSPTVVSNRHRDGHLAWPTRPLRARGRRRLGVGDPRGAGRARCP